MKQQVYLKNVTTLVLDRDRCVGCGMCTVVCPHGVFRLTEGNVRIEDRDACMECGACSRNCPAGAISVRAGVGCAAAILSGYFSGKEVSCDCSSESDKPCC